MSFYTGYDEYPSTHSGKKNREENYNMNGVTMMIISIVVLGGAYLFYGRYLERKWGIDP